MQTVHVAWRNVVGEEQGHDTIGTERAKDIPYQHLTSRMRFGGLRCQEGGQFSDAKLDGILRLR